MQGFVPLFHALCYYFPFCSLVVVCCVMLFVLVVDVDSGELLWLDPVLRFLVLVAVLVLLAFFVFYQ